MDTVLDILRKNEDFTHLKDPVKIDSDAFDESGKEYSILWFLVVNDDKTFKEIYLPMFWYSKEGKEFLCSRGLNPDFFDFYSRKSSPVIPFLKCLEYHDFRQYTDEQILSIPDCIQTKFKIDLKIGSYFDVDLDKTVPIFMTKRELLENCYVKLHKNDTVKRNLLVSLRSKLVP